jgi:DNA uptake protein ComE-like DNA-binding protein
MVGATVGLLATVAALTTTPTAAAPPAEGEYAALLAQEAQSLQAVCGTKCHKLELFANARMSYDAWHETVQKMIDRGANATEDQLLDIMDYLHQTRTLIDVNAADAEELQIVLNVSPSQAQALVERRSRRKFSDLRDLKSVAGLDSAALDAKADLLVYQ